MVPEFIRLDALKLIGCKWLNDTPDIGVNFTHRDTIYIAESMVDSLRSAKGSDEVVAVMSRVKKILRLPNGLQEYDLPIQLVVTATPKLNYNITHDSD